MRMAEQPTLFDHAGRQIREPSSEDSNLPVGVQALIEARVNTAISQMKVHNRVDLKELERDHKKNWRILKILAALLMIFSFVTAFYAPAKLATWVTDQVDKNFTEPKIKESADRVIETKMSTYVDQQLLPLHEQSSALHTSLETIRDDIKNKQKALQLEQVELSKQLKIRELAIAAKAGSRTAYTQLLAMQGDPEQPKSLLAASVKEIELFYNVDRSLFSAPVLVKALTLKDPGYAVDEVIYTLRHKPQLAEAAINTLGSLKIKGTVRELCKLVSDSDDLRVAARATKAIQEITGTIIQPLDFIKVAEWWEEHSTDPDYNGSYDGYIKVAKDMWNTLLPWSKIDMFIQELETTISSDPNALHSRCLKAGFLLMQNKDKEAKALLDEVRVKRADYYWLYVWDAAFHVKTNNTQEAEKLINKAFLKSPTQDVDQTIKRWKIFAPIYSSDEVKWPFQKPWVSEWDPSVTKPLRDWWMTDWKRVGVTSPTNIGWSTSLKKSILDSWARNWTLSDKGK